MPAFRTTLALLLVSALLVPLETLYAMQLSNTALFAQQRVIILLHERATPPFITRLQEQHSARVRHTFSSIPAIAVTLPSIAIPNLMQEAGIENVFEDMQVSVQLANSVPQIGADLVHAEGADGSGVRVCIVDTGVDDSHPALQPLAAERDFANGDNDATDDNGHGTHVAGIIASQDSTWKGVAPGATLLAAKVLSDVGNGYASDVIAGIEWCVQQGANVINMSLGGGTYATACDSEPIAQASNAAVAQGVTVFAASGNSGREDRIAAPACASSVIAVGAVNASDEHESFSNGGTELDIVAPGTSINSTFPGGVFRKLTGTSMATPHAAGVAALLLSAASLTPEQMREVLRNTAVDLGPQGFDAAYGYGRIDAYAAYQQVRGNPPPPPPPPPPEVETIVFSDDFESTLQQWTTSGNRWEATEPSKRAVPNSSTSNRVAHASGCSVSNGCALTLGQPLDLRTFETASVSFWRYVDRSLDNGEYLRVDAFDGTQWRTIASWTNGNGDDDAWHLESFVLDSSFMKQDFNLRFVTYENSSIEDVEVDDVSLEATLPAARDPIANAGPDQTVSDGDGNGSEIIALDGSQSADPDGTIVSYEWNEGDTVLGTDATVTVTLPVGNHTITLTVTDDTGATSTDTVTVTVNANQAPIANAGPDQTVSDGDGNGSEIIALDGSQSADPDGTIVSYEWSDGTVILGSGALATAEFPIGTHTMILTVADDTGAIGTDTVEVSIPANQPPVADAGPDQAVNDGDTDGTETVTLDGSRSVDPDGMIASYEWSEGGTILGTGATLTVPFSTGVRTVMLTVADVTGATGSDTVVVTVAANQPPTADAGPDQTVSDTDGNDVASVTLDGSGSSDPDGHIVAYEWREGAALLGTAVTCTTDVSVGTHTMTLTVTDEYGAQSADEVLVTVVSQPQPQEVFREDFGQGLNRWQSGSSRYVWEVHEPNEQQVPGHDGSNTVAHADWCYEQCTLTLAQPIDLRAFSTATLSLWRFVDQSIDSGESLLVELSDGTQWSTLAEWGQSNGDDTWHSESLTLPPSTLTSNVLLRFTSNTNSFIEDMEFDDIVILGTP